MTPKKYSLNVVVGTRLFCVKPDAGAGTIVEITPTPLSVPKGARGRRFGIVFDNGKRAPETSEEALRGPQWQIQEAIYDASQVRQVLANAEQYARMRQEHLDQARAALPGAAEAFRQDPGLTYLRQGEDASGKLAAINLRKSLQRAFPGVEFRVHKLTYGRLQVYWTDGPTTAKVHAITQRHILGYEDHAEGIYRPVPNAWAEVFGGAQQIEVTRAYSISAMERAITATFAAGGDRLHGIEKPSGEDVLTGHAWATPVPGTTDNLEELIFATAHNLEV